MLAENASVRINVPPLPVMKDEISVAGETEGVQSVKAKIMELFKDIVSYTFYFCTLFSMVLMGCRVSNWWVQNWKYFCLRINISKGNY